MRKVYHKASMRKFLNDASDNDTASVCVYVNLDAEEKWDRKKKKTVKGEFGVPLLDSNELELRSCDRTVHLHFTCYAPSDIRRRRRKLAILRDALDMIEQGLDKYEAVLAANEVTKKK